MKYRKTILMFFIYTIVFGGVSLVFKNDYSQANIIAQLLKGLGFAALMTMFKLYSDRRKKNNEGSTKETNL